MQPAKTANIAVWAGREKAILFFADSRISNTSLRQNLVTTGFKKVVIFKDKSLILLVRK